MAVASYEATLGYRTTGSESKWVETKFTLPKDCKAMEQFADIHFGSFDMTRIRRYSSFRAYCSKAHLLASGKKEVLHDYISNYDFSTLSLALVPSDVLCTGVTSNSWFDFCEKVKSHSQEICHPKPCSYPLSYVEFILGENENSLWYWFIDTEYSDFDEDCRFHNNAFTGDIIIKEDRVYCGLSQDEYKNKNLSVDLVGFRDMNQDGYMDAIIKITLAVEGSAPDKTDIFILTRLSEKGKVELITNTRQQK
ncbi:hypothetical protein JYT94_00685 [bacterium AH-315-P11]|nr:hypothetical protein [bacterium AH-315-P11]